MVLLSASAVSFFAVIYVLIIALAVFFVFLCLVGRFEAFPQSYSTEEAFRHSLFQVASLMTTAGYTTTDYNVWPMLGRLEILPVLILFNKRTWKRV